MSLIQLLVGLREGGKIVKCILKQQYSANARSRTMFFNCENVLKSINRGKPNQQDFPGSQKT